MALPLINAPEFKTILPSSKQEVYYRPFLVKEEKILLTALEGREQDEIINAVIRILENCVRLEDAIIRKLPYYDIEFLFLQIRAKSIDNIIKLNLRHGSDVECDHTTAFELNLDDVGVIVPEEHTNKIMLNDTVGIKMIYPTIDSLEKTEMLMNSGKVDDLFTFFADNIEMIFDENDVYENSTTAEKIEFIENLNKEQFNKIVSFYQTMPYLGYDIKYTCSECGKDELIPMRGLQSFFM